jgi:chemotaxis protein CheD
MFSLSGNALDIGANNNAAVRAELAKIRIPIAGAATGGTRGRTIRVDVATGHTEAQEAGGTPQVLLDKKPVAKAA